MTKYVQKIEVLTAQVTYPMPTDFEALGRAIGSQAQAVSMRIDCGSRVVHVEIAVVDSDEHSLEESTAASIKAAREAWSAALVAK